jgi:hypothetical protein
LFFFFPSEGDFPTHTTDEHFGQKKKKKRETNLKAA